MTKAQKVLKARRSAAALKGWETRRSRYVAPRWIPYSGSICSPDALPPDEVARYLAAQNPTPWVGIQAAVKRWWLRAAGWFR